MPIFVCKDKNGLPGGGLAASFSVLILCMVPYDVVLEWNACILGLDTAPCGQMVAVVNVFVCFFLPSVRVQDV